MGLSKKGGIDGSFIVATSPGSTSDGGASMVGAGPHEAGRVS